MCRKIAARRPGRMSTTEYDNDQAYHRPVMLAQCLAAMDLQPDGRYVDVTFGGGGHSARILEKLGMTNLGVRGGYMKWKLRRDQAN